MSFRAAHGSDFRGHDLAGFTHLFAPLKLREVEIRNQEVEAGKHTLQVSMDVRGNGGGVFTYVKDYAVSVQSSYDFEVATGRRTILFAHPTSKGGVKKAYSERPSFVYEERVEDLPEN